MCVGWCVSSCDAIANDEDKGKTGGKHTDKMIRRVRGRHTHTDTDSNSMEIEEFIYDGRVYNMRHHV